MSALKRSERKQGCAAGVCGTLPCLLGSKAQGPRGWSWARSAGWGGGLLPKVQQPQHAYLHLGGHSVSLTGEEPRVLTPVVGSEVQNDPYA